MGTATAAVGILPTYAAIGMLSPTILVLLRLAQGLALGGEYGGAATYVAEHAPDGKRGLHTSWIQTTATLGFFLSLVVIGVCRWKMDEATFKAWGWRIPFLISLLLLAISIYIRLKLNESPVFLEMKAQGKGSKAPLRESFTDWANLKIVLLALFGAAAGQGVVWYTGQFYALFFLTGVSGPGHRAFAGNGAVHLLRFAVGPHRPQEDHARWMPAGRGDLLSYLRSDDAFRESGARAVRDRDEDLARGE
jgi:MFS family permease